MSDQNDLFYVGRALNNVDAKGRLSLPSGFRKTLNSVYSGAENRIYLRMDKEQPFLLGYDRRYSQRQFESIESRYTDPNDPRCIEEKNALFATADVITIDSDGRLVLNSLLRRHAQIERHVLFMGGADTFTLWNPQIFLDHNQDKTNLIVMVTSMMEEKKIPIGETS